MGAESGTAHMHWLGAESRPSAFHSSYTEKSFGAAFCKGTTLSAEMRLGMPARSLEEDTLSLLPRHCCCIFQADPSCCQYLQRHGDASKPPGRGSGARRLPPGDVACPHGAGDRRAHAHTHTRIHRRTRGHTHGHTDTHTDTDTRGACAQPARVSPAPSSRAILLLLDFSSRSILPALP